MHPGCPVSLCCPLSYCPREGYKVASHKLFNHLSLSKVTVPVRGIRLHRSNRIWQQSSPSVTVPVRGIRLHHCISANRKIRSRYCPREGYKVASPVPGRSTLRLLSYCPREGYKVASSTKAVTSSKRFLRYCPREGYKVASRSQPRRGISQNGYCPREGYKVASCALAHDPQGRRVTVPVRGIRLHLGGDVAVLSEVCYCPREGYKVASIEIEHDLKQPPCYCPREGYKVASGAAGRGGHCARVTVPVRGIRLHPRLLPRLCGASGLLSP